MTLADMPPLAFGDFMGLFSHTLRTSTSAETEPCEIYCRLGMSTAQTREGDWGMDGVEWINCLFESPTNEESGQPTPFAALKGSGSGWTDCVGPFSTPDALYLVLANKVAGLGRILRDVLGGSAEDASAAAHAGGTVEPPKPVEPGQASEGQVTGDEQRGAETS
jgi:hypothetical protein